jgi:imidazolonepropionase-like amidohydrolase
MRAFINATVLCPVNGLIDNGTILFDDKIRAIGENISLPRGTKSIDARRKYVVPGFIDAHTHQ